MGASLFRSVEGLLASPSNAMLTSDEYVGGLSSFRRIACVAVGIDIVGDEGRGRPRGNRISIGIRSEAGHIC